MLIGLSYDGKDSDGNPKWEGLNNFKFRKFFFGAFFQVSQILHNYRLTNSMFPFVHKVHSC